MVALPQGPMAVIEVDGEFVGTARGVLIDERRREIVLERLDGLANAFFTERVSPLGPDDDGTPVGDVTIVDQRIGETVHLLAAAVMNVSSGQGEVRLRGSSLAIDRGAEASPSPSS